MQTSFTEPPYKKSVDFNLGFVCYDFCVICTIFSVCCQFNKKTGVGGTEGLGSLVALDDGRCF